MQLKKKHLLLSLWVLTTALLSYPSGNLIAAESRQLNELKSTWKKNARKYQRIRVVAQLEELGPPPLTSFDKESVQKYRDLTPEQYTIKKWQEKVWLDKDQFRSEITVLDSPPGETRKDQSITFSGKERRMLQTDPVSKQKTGAISMKDAGHGRQYWSRELNPFYLLVRNSDEDEFPDFWSKLTITGTTEYQGQKCLLVSPPEVKSRKVVYYVAPEWDYSILKVESYIRGNLVHFTELEYEESSAGGWIPTGWTYTALKPDKAGKYNLLAQKRTVLIEEFVPRFEETLADLFVLTFPDEAEVTLFGSTGGRVIARGDLNTKPEMAEAKKEETSQTAPSEESDLGLQPTHQPMERLVAHYDDQPINLNTFCLDQEGNLLLSCGGKVNQLVLSEE
ncbi:MAG: hypothetical protein R3C11_10025 [Planctomycetaceae bacterium]